MVIETPERLPELERIVDLGVREGFSTSRHLEHARRQATERRYSDLLIVDADAHHTEVGTLADQIKYIEDPVLRHRFEASLRTGTSMLFSDPTQQSIAGRLLRYDHGRSETAEFGEPKDVTILRRELDAIGFDYQVVFTTAMLNLGMHPDPYIQTALSWAYSRWFVEEIIPHDPRIKTMVYLPFNDPAACLRMVDYFADKPGVVGFMVASAHHRPVHDNAYMRLYAALEERDIPIGFHAIYHQRERVVEVMNRFISVHSLGFIMYNMIHIINLVINGIPERFPKLKILWIENGLAVWPFLMQRLDNEYMMRTSEAPLLKKLPSEYMRDMYYTSHPLETNNAEALEMTMRMINAETQLVFSSDYPHWDFNLPSMIYDLPFLSEQAKRNILGENARRLFKLESKGAAAKLG
jgi:uncharacterized protein